MADSDDRLQRLRESRRTLREGILGAAVESGGSRVDPAQLAAALRLAREADAQEG